MSIVIHNQTEYEQHKDSAELLVIECKCPTERIIVRNRSRVEVRGNSSVEALGNSSIVARDNSSVLAWDNSSVEGLDNSFVEARDNSSVVARGNSSVEAFDNSSTMNWDNSSTLAWGNSSVLALGNSFVVARDNSSVMAIDNSHVLICNDNRVWLFGNASAKKWIQPKYDRTVLDAILEKDGEDFILYKCVNPETDCDFHSGQRYEIGAEVVAPNFDPNPDRQCGGGFHLCFSALGAQVYNTGKIIKCLVRPEDIVIYPNDISKIRCRAVRPVAVVDARGNVITEERG